MLSSLLQPYCLVPLQAMLLFTGSAAFKPELSPTFKKLAEDENVRVRRSIASGFHEVRRREGEEEGGGEGKGGRREMRWNERGRK